MGHVQTRAVRTRELGIIAAENILCIIKIKSVEASLPRQNQVLVIIKVPTHASGHVPRVPAGGPELGVGGSPEGTGEHKPVVTTRLDVVDSALVDLVRVFLA